MKKPSLLYADVVYRELPPCPVGAGLSGLLPHSLSGMPFSGGGTPARATEEGSDGAGGAGEGESKSVVLPR